MSIQPETPMLKQYMSIKSQHSDSILFFRLGDFYEMFYDDAVEASKILGIALTSRNKGEAQPVPLCGVPHHACQPYIARLLAAGKKVAICEQVEDPKTAKGVVKREVVRIVTPAMVLDETVLEAGTPNYLACLYDSRIEKKPRSGVEGGQGGKTPSSGRRQTAATASKNSPLEEATPAPTIGMAYFDLSTAEFQAGVLPTFETLLDELAKLDPKEILVPRVWEKEGHIELLRRHLPQSLVAMLADAQYDTAVVTAFEGAAEIGKHFPAGLKAAGGLWNYVCHTQKRNPPHVTALRLYEMQRFLILDEAAQKNLELLKTSTQEKRGALLHLLHETLTPMGARKLRHWLLYPLLELGRIQKRQGAVQTLLDSFALQQAVETHLKPIADLERLVARIATGHANARDLVALAASLETLPGLVAALEKERGFLEQALAHLQGFEPLAARIRKTLVEEPPLALKEGGLIRAGFHAELDTLKSISGSGKNFIAQLEEKEKQATGIGSLKVRFNRVFGYTIEVTHAHRDKIPAHYIRKQTLTNAERYITPALKEYEEKVLGAEEKTGRIEYELFLALRDEAARWGAKIQKAASQIAVLDGLSALAKVAAKYRWVCPAVTADAAIHIEEGRHPIVEQLTQDRFVPNDIHLDGDKNRFLMITGPNMAGKSTVMRQTALIVILAQMGSFVPAAKAEIGVVDRIFTRVGASDRLARGESTFMVEMVEAAHILKEATAKSLVIIDEIGRGTSTYDGVAIAWAVAEHLHNQTKAKTLFATHYHELIDLPNSCDGMKNFNIAVKEWNDKIIFLRKLLPGGTSKSYGVEVAKLAGLPPAVIARAKAILGQWEHFAAERDAGLTQQLGLFNASAKETPVHPVLKELENIDLNHFTPIQAFEFLAYLKSKLK